METIKLGTKVVVSDPCYEIPNWCQAVIRNVRKGTYRVQCTRKEFDGWGERNTKLMVTHEKFEPNNLRWSLSNHAIGVDSGQAGVFDFKTYRVDSDNVPMGKGDISFFTIEDGDDSAEKWYQKMCSYTLSDEGWSIYPQGAVCRSGIGDGSYELWIARDEKRKVVGFIIDFLLED